MPPYLIYMKKQGAGLIQNAFDITGTPVFNNRWTPPDSFYNSGPDDYIVSDIKFKPDGTEMYLMQSGKTQQWTLSTPWDPTSATLTFTDVNFVKGDAMFISSDGTKIFWLLSNQLYFGSLGTPWVLSTVSEGASTGGVANGRGLVFSPDGLKMYTIVDNASDDIQQFNLLNAFDLSPWYATSPSPALTFSTGANHVTPRAIEISSDGTKMYSVGSYAGLVYQYDMSTPYDVSSMTFTGGDTFDGSTPAGAPTEGTFGSITFSTDGSKFFIGGNDRDVVISYSTS